MADLKHLKELHCTSIPKQCVVATVMRRRSRRSRDGECYLPMLPSKDLNTRTTSQCQRHVVLKPSATTGRLIASAIVSAQATMMYMGWQYCLALIFLSRAIKRSRSRSQTVDRLGEHESVSTFHPRILVLHIPACKLKAYLIENQSRRPADAPLLRLVRF